MVRYLMMSFVLLSAVSIADPVKDATEKATMLKKGFVHDHEKKFEAMRSVAPPGVNPPPADIVSHWHKCSAYTAAMLKQTELFVIDDENAYCNDKADCTAANMGGMCTQAAHKSQLVGYDLYKSSAEGKRLRGLYLAEKCHGPVGLCLPIRDVECNKTTNRCEGKWGNVRDGVPVSFMADAKKK